MFIKYNCTSNKTWIFYKILYVIKNIYFFIIDKFINNKDSKLLILLLLYSLQQEQELAYSRLEI
jgi:hypothetical protein